MANGLGIARRDPPPPPPRRGPYNQDEEVRRFQEARKAEERERIRREQEALEQRRRGYRPEDPQMGPDKRPYWPYDRPYVGPRVTAETIRVMDNAPGVNRITSPAIMVGDAAGGGTPPGPPVGARPGARRAPRPPRMAGKYGRGELDPPRQDMDPAYSNPRLPPEKRKWMAENGAFHSRQQAARLRRNADAEDAAGNSQGAAYLRDLANQYEAKARQYDELLRSI